jgi:hypothetical protein
MIEKLKFSNDAGLLIGCLSAVWGALPARLI